jgi:hypothetical protein
MDAFVSTKKQVEDEITDGAAWDGDVAIPQHIQQGG